MKNQLRAPRGTMIFLMGATLGVVSACLLDPISGRRRRALIRNQGVHLVNRFQDVSLRRTKMIKNRLYGMMAEVRRLMQSPPSDPDTLMRRVRSEFGHVVSHAKTIKVHADEDGSIILSGPVLADEMESLVSCVRSVPGVKRVINQLDLQPDVMALSRANNIQQGQVHS